MWWTCPRNACTCEHSDRVRCPPLQNLTVSIQACFRFRAICSYWAKASLAGSARELVFRYTTRYCPGDSNCKRGAGGNAEGTRGGRDHGDTRSLSPAVSLCRLIAGCAVTSVMKSIITRPELVRFGSNTMKTAWQDFLKEQRARQTDTLYS